MPVFMFVGSIGNDDLEDECHQQPQVREKADMKIFLDDELLAVKKRENHRDGHCGGIVESMEERSGEKNFFFHRASEKRIYTKPQMFCQSNTQWGRHSPEFPSYLFLRMEWNL